MRKWASVSGMVVAAMLVAGCNDNPPGAWGANFFGQLGNGSTTPSTVPLEVDTSGALADTRVVGVAAGNTTSCAVKADGTTACWGGNKSPITTPQSWPMIDSLAGRFAADVQTGLLGQSMLTTDGRVATRASPTQPTTVLEGALIAASVVQLSHTSGHSCAITSLGAAACWGNNFGGEIGDGTAGNQRFEPVWVDTSGVLAGKTLTSIQTGAVHTCAVTQDNSIACWGVNEQGQLGDGSTQQSLVPVLTDTTGVLAGQTITSLSDGSARHMCAVTAEGGAACWGQNGSGQLGDGTTTNSSVPVTVQHVGALAGRKIKALAVGGGAMEGYGSTCALLDDGTMACWGHNGDGQLGDGTTTDSPVPVAVVDLPGGPTPATQVASGGSHVVALYDAEPGSEFVPITPQRVLDTRQGTGPVGTGQTVAVDLADLIPVGSTAVTFNVTATGQTASGVAVVKPVGSELSAEQTSTLNWSSAQSTVANGFIAKVSAERGLELSVTSTGTTELVLDITGYFTAPGDPSAGLYMAADRRLYDSRDLDGPLLPGESRTISVVEAGTNSSGADAPVVSKNGVVPTAAAVNVTVTGTQGSGVLAVADTPTASTSTVNWTAAGQTVANAVITPLSPNGQLTVTNNGTTAAEVVVDLTGTFVPASTGQGARFFAIDPARNYDSRNTRGPGAAVGELIAGMSRVSPLPVPHDAVAVALNTTVTGTSGTGFLAVTPPQLGIPSTSTINWFASPTTRANGGIVPVSRTTLQAYAGGNYATQYVLDSAGYFR